MPVTARVQCLLFVKSEVPANEAPASLKGYALVAPGWQNLFALRSLEPSIQVVSHDRVNPAPNTKFEVVEIFFDAVTFDPDGAVGQEHPRVYVDKFNEEFFRRLFPDNTNIDIICEFRNSKLVNALVQDNYKIIEKLLKSGAKVAYRHPEGGTLAHLAVEKSSTALVKLLAKCGLDINAGGKDNATPLHAAVKKKNMSMIQALLNNGANCNSQTNDGISPLFMAVTMKTVPIKIFKFLVENGADPNAKMTNGWTSLHFAADKGDVEICEILLQFGASVEAKIISGDMAGATPLHTALKKKRFTAAKLLIEKGASLETQCQKGRNALYYAVASNELETVTYLLGRNLDVNSAGNKFAFHLAFCKDANFTPVLEKMLTHGFTVSAEDASAGILLLGAIHKNYYETVEKLLEAGADVHYYDTFLGLKSKPIHVASRFSDRNMVQLLLDHGADLEETRGNGRLNTPIADAVEFGKLEVVKLFLEKGVSVRDRPDLLAKAGGRRWAINQYLEKLEVLLEYGASVVDPPSWTCRETAMGKALSVGRAKAVELLMKYGSRFDFGSIRRGESGDYEGASCLKTYLNYGFFGLDSSSERKLQKLFSEYDIGHDKKFNWHGRQQKKCGEYLAQHVIKLQAAGKSVGEVIPNNYFQVFELEDFRIRCEKEIARMTTEIGDTEITLFDILTGSIYQVARYTRNASILQTLTDYNFINEFPIYGSILECKFRQCDWRKELLDKGIKAFGFLSHQLPKLPYDLKEDIVSLLNNQDLTTLQKCFRAN